MKKLLLLNILILSLSMNMIHAAWRPGEIELVDYTMRNEGTKSVECREIKNFVKCFPVDTDAVDDVLCLFIEFFEPFVVKEVVRRHPGPREVIVVC